MEKSARPRTALNECVKVVVRCRPLAEKERTEGYDEILKSKQEKKWFDRLSATPAKIATEKQKYDGPEQV